MRIRSGERGRHYEKLVPEAPREPFLELVGVPVRYVCQLRIELRQGQGIDDGRCVCYVDPAGKLPFERPSETIDTGSPRPKHVLHASPDGSVRRGGIAVDFDDIVAGLPATADGPREQLQLRFGLGLADGFLEQGVGLRLAQDRVA